MTNVQTEVEEKIQTHVSRSVTVFRKSCRFCEVMWTNTV